MAEAAAWAAAEAVDSEVEAWAWVAVDSVDGATAERSARALGPPCSPIVGERFGRGCLHASTRHRDLSREVTRSRQSESGRAQVAQIYGKALHPPGVCQN